MAESISFRSNKFNKRDTAEVLHTRMYLLTCFFGDIIFVQEQSYDIARLNLSWLPLPLREQAYP